MRNTLQLNREKEMAVDMKAQAIFDATNDVINVARRLRALTAGVLQPVAGDVQPHPDTIAALKTEAIALYGEWEIARDALDASFLA